ncbi:hypothetical protein DID78_04130 [Candidatus Marinamargulisbacteria bacterium SCGC AG-343-D04]|nr:hypothetical protein DID78_04130 [Candidatus Marinamargulisbacteria bacterium SCGC AG-343-D04]
MLLYSIMTLIFYDFETSSRYLVGQILTYAFVVTDEHLNPIQSFSGRIKLNRMQCPEVDAVLTNKLDIMHLQQTGKSEYETAHEIFSFLQNCISTYGICTLVGFNSNTFDLSFLRTLLIRYGINPYFMGKLKNKDILHWAQSLAFSYPEEFPWVLTEKNDKAYYSFRLEDLTQSLGLLNEAQSHDALEDVQLTIKLVYFLEQRFQQKLVDFIAFDISACLPSQEKHPIMGFKSRHFAEKSETPKKFIHRYYYCLSREKNMLLAVDLERLALLSSEEFSDENLLKTIRYLNPNKHFFIAESSDISFDSKLSSLPSMIDENSFYRSLAEQPSSYFTLIKKDWDIDYQIHELGFERIDQLRSYVDRFMAHKNSYPSLLRELLTKRKHEKDTYLIQLFNRVYLNYHPDPDPALSARYLIPRYQTGSMYKGDPQENFFQQQFDYLNSCLENHELETDLPILQSLHQYYSEFQQQFLKKIF